MILLKYGVKITARMGINTGTVSAGNMGSERRMQYTVMGDAVTLAEELEPANKVFGTWIMIGPATFEQAGDHIRARGLHKLAAGHAGQPTPIYELVGWKKEKFLEYWSGKPIPELVLESMRKMLPEKALAYHDYYSDKRLPESPLLKDLRELFAGVKGPAVECMKVNDIRSVLVVRDELEQLKNDLKRYEPHYVSSETADGVERDIEALEREEWKRSLLQWKRDLKECAVRRQALKGKIKKEEYDHYINTIDMLEKSAECFFKRIAFAASNDPVAVEMAGHLKELVTGSGLPETADTEALAEKSSSLENEINSRLSSFAEGLRGRAEEYHALISDFCEVTEEKRRVLELFREGLELYLRREWDGAAEKMREALAVMPDDGPCGKLLESIEELKLNPPAEDWDGTWKE